MKRVVATSLCLMLLGAVATVYAQVVQDGQSFREVLQGQPSSGIVRADSTGKIFTVDSDGNQAIYDIAPNRTANLLFQAAIDDTSAVGHADSSDVLTTRAVRISALRIRLLIPAGIAAPNFVRLAVQIRGHQNGGSDSTQIFPWLLKHAAAGDSLTFGAVGLPTAVAYDPSTEFIVTIPSHAAGVSKWGTSQNRQIDLRSVLGRDWWSDYTSVRVRVLQAGATGGTTRVTVHLVGTPL